MITIVAKQKVKKEEITKFVETAKTLVKETHLYDAGCVNYDLFQDANAPQIFTFIEEWESREALDKHMESVHFKKLFPLLEGMCIEAPEVVFYTKI